MPRLYPIRGGVKPPPRGIVTAFPARPGRRNRESRLYERIVAAFPAGPGRRNRESRLYEGSWRRSRQGRDAETAKAAPTKDRGGVPGKAGTQKPRKPPLRKDRGGVPGRA